METRNVSLDERTESIVKKILALREELDKEWMSTPDREFISEAYDTANEAITELADSVLQIGAYNLRLNLSL